MNELDRAFLLLEQKKFLEAQEAFSLLYEHAPRDPRVNFGVGLIFSHLGQNQAAIAHLKAAAKKGPKIGIVFTKLAIELLIDVQYEEALRAARKGASLEPRSAYAQTILGQCYNQLNRPVMAKACFENALKLNPDQADSLLQLSRLERTFGNFVRASELLEEAYKADPNSAGIILNKLEEESASIEDEVVTKAISILNEKPEEVAKVTIGNIAFAVAKLHEKAGNLKTAFEYYNEYRDLLYNPFSIHNRKEQVKAYKQVFTEKFFETRSSVSFSTTKPVFIFGMPRSGTTLAEQIISKHAQASSVGECNYFLLRQKEYFGGYNFSTNLFSVLSKYTEKDFKKVGRRYLKELENADDKAIRIVDKMPHNFEMLWLIALLFPNAKFILMKRNSNDICNSIYTTSFNSWHSYNIDQKTLGQYYNTYEDLIDHWKSVLPIEIFELDYENLIADQEEESRKLLDHIGLDWDPACLEFYNNENRVFTASQSQVRQPIYSSSVGRWKKYENYIQPLLQELNIKHTLGTT